MTDHALALLLQAIALVETGNNPNLIGRHGERGAHQLTPAVVREVGGYCDASAARHLRRLERLMEHADITPTPYRLALAWNAGLGAVQRSRIPASSRDYAERVTNTFESLQRRSAPMAEERFKLGRYLNAPAGAALTFSVPSHRAREPLPRTIVGSRGDRVFFFLL